MTVTPEESVDAANGLYGRHPGFRALHAKGIYLKGTFTANPRAAELTRAAHMQGEPVPVTVRFSNAGGNPRIPDYAPEIRGLGVKFHLPDGSSTDIVCQTVPRFPFSTPEGFVELLRAQQRSPAAIWRQPLLWLHHPKVLLTLPVNLLALRPPRSYATIRYFAVHAFKFVDADGGSRYVRYTFVPALEEGRLKPSSAKPRGRDYLQDEMCARLEKGPVRFTLALQIAAPGDDPNDPSQQWPDDRERVAAGTLELNEIVSDPEMDGKVMVFDPVRVTDGIELSDDPVLRFRTRSYSESVKRRTS